MDDIFMNDLKVVAISRYHPSCVTKRRTNLSWTFIMFFCVLLSSAFLLLTIVPSGDAFTVQEVDSFFSHFILSFFPPAPISLRLPFPFIFLLHSFSPGPLLHLFFPSLSSFIPCRCAFELQFPSPVSLTFL